MELNGMNLRQTAELLASEINIKSLLYLYSTSSDLNKITSMLLKRKLELQQFFKSDFSSDLINVLKSLVPIYNLPNELSKQKSEILSATYCEEFLESIRHYLLGVKKIQRNRSKLLEELNFIILYLDVNINQIPPSNIHYNRFWSVLKALHETLVDRGFQNENSVSWISELMQLIEKKSLYINRKNLSWRECSVYPHPVDIFESKDLVPNKTFGPYKDLSEYLDIHFKLYKEDFESNLREGLLQYKAKLRGAILKDNLELYVYNRVRVESLEVDKSAKNGVFHKITITIGNKEESNDFNKIFMNGSLLLFSQCSQFSTFILAILVDFINLPEEQRKWSKSLKVSVISDPSSLKVGHTYTMIEPKAFFEPYHQVLKVLQAIDYHNFPMTKYIVHADVSPGLPNYINFNTEYNFSGRRLKLFGNNNWPANLLKLNSQQIEALQASLTHEFVLIQGPPGTGKTYLAENIIKVLIENKHLSTPILLISSKNDSVDRILEPLAISGRKVVRLGGQSKSAVLKKCSIGNVIKRFGGREMADSINNLKDVIVRKIHANEKIDEVLNSFNREQKSFLEFREGEDARQLLSAGIEIIGGTTAGCARLRCMLDRLQPEVIIVEDANEVLEAHIIASLSKGCKHVILIGDHKQLQPNVSKDGSEMYNLDVSLLERMERCGMKCSTLTEQWRMRPEIAALLSPLVYPNLLNHPNVIRLPDVKGMKKNLFFLDHNVSEEKVVDSQGYRNKHEGDLLLGLAEYLLKQGYSNSDITILSPYTAQQNYMRQAAKSNPSTQNIEIQMIDSYSGQENMIILLSLVRSQSSAIGFLSSNNRITVALSRAKCGLYIVGNMRTLINGSQLWSSINEVLKQQNGIGKSIELKCQKHQTITTVTKAEDFKSNQGGCNMPCKSKLACGHICKLSCHSLADGHRNYKCKSPCPRYCKEKLHRCKKKCYEDCEPCYKDVDILLPCGHSSKKKCFVDKETHIASYVCKESCLRLCPRQIHKCKKKCHEHCGPCNEMSERQLACGHISLIPCSKDDLDYICVSPTIVSFLCFGQLTVPCSEADSCFYSRVER